MTEVAGVTLMLVFALSHVFVSLSTPLLTIRCIMSLCFFSAISSSRNSDGGLRGVVGRLHSSLRMSMFSLAKIVAIWSPTIHLGHSTGGSAAFLCQNGRIVLLIC